MAELSRKKKFQDLRDQLDMETSVSAAEPAAEPVKLTRSSRSVKAAQHSNTTKASVSNSSSIPDLAVMDELLGEVKQYNLSNGDRVSEDTQINILRTLDDEGDIELKRRAHMETMEPAVNDGDTTLDINSKDIEEVSRTSAKADLFVSAVKEPETKAKEEILEITPVSGSKKPESVEIFDLSADDFDKTQRQTTEVEPKSRKAVKAAKKAQREAEKSSSRKTETLIESTEPTGQYPREELRTPKPAAQSSGKAGNIFLIVLIIILLALIGITLYLIAKANLI